MAAIFNNLRHRYSAGNMLTRLVFINVALFVVVRLTDVVLTLSGVSGGVITWLTYIELPASLPRLVQQVWSLFTYMILHFDLMHILFNMVWLYGFGRLFLYFFQEKQLGGLYLLGGLSGALLYLIAYNTLPYFAEVAASSYLLGASAAVIAIVVATAVHAPNFRVQMLFVGSVPLKYIAIITIFIDAISITSGNAGGHIAHLGGAIMGAVFALALARGKDITQPINHCIDRVANLFKPRPPKMKVSKNKNTRNENDGQYNARKHNEMEEVDRILEKIKSSGYTGLSIEEKKRLFDAGKN